MRLLVVILATYLVSCGSTQIKKDIFVDDKKYDLMVIHSMKNANMDIPCKRVTTEINNHLKNDSNFKIIQYDRFRMTEGIRFILDANYNLIPSQYHQSKRYLNAYTEVVNVCKKYEALSYLNALELALSKIRSNTN